MAAQIEVSEHTFVALHDDPDRRANTSINELQREQLRGHLLSCRCGLVAIALFAGSVGGSRDAE